MRRGESTDCDSGQRRYGRGVVPVSHPDRRSAPETALRVLLALMLVGAARGVQLYGSPVSSVLWHDFHWSEAMFTGLDSLAASMMYATAAFVFVAPRGRRWAWGLLPATVWLLLVPLAKLRSGGDFAYMLAPLTQGNRPLGLMALGLLMAAPADAIGLATQRAQRLLRWGVTAVFASHGLEALFQNPRFVDYLLVSTARLTPTTMHEATAHLLLYGIGAVDVLVALLVARSGGRWVLSWACAWGFLTAVMRLVYFGPAGGAHHAAIRALNGGGALVLLLMSRTPRSHRATGVTRASQRGWIRASI